MIEEIWCMERNWYIECFFQLDVEKYTSLKGFEGYVYFFEG